MDEPRTDRDIVIRFAFLVRWVPGFKILRSEALLTQLFLCLVNAKVNSLHDFDVRIASGSSPQPSGIDIANTLKYFIQTLLRCVSPPFLITSSTVHDKLLFHVYSLLKGVRIVGHETYGPRQTDFVRLRDLPKLNYDGLFKNVNRFVDLMPSIQLGQQGILYE